MVSTERSILLVDFGASRIKSVVWSPSLGVCVESAECPAPTPWRGAWGEVELDPEAYWGCLEQAAGQLLEKHADVDTLWLCTEMHGMVVVDSRNRRPLSGYISWRDERACRDIEPVGDSTLKMLACHAREILHETGLRLRPGLPLLTLAHLQRLGCLPHKFRLATLSDWLLLRGGEEQPSTHLTMAAATGLYSLRESKWSERLFEMAGVDRERVIVPTVRDCPRALGHIVLGGRRISVWGGVGDLQAAALGAGFPGRAPMLVNLGTGSQVLSTVGRAPLHAEQRPGAAGGQFCALTHIPCGRALSVYGSFLDECGEFAGGAAFFWRKFASLDVVEIVSASGDVDLNVFEAAWRYAGGGRINAINEGRFSVSAFMISLARSWLNQYVEAMEYLDGPGNKSDFVVAGALSRKLEFVVPTLEQLSGRRGMLAGPETGEETLDGLLALARLVASRASPPIEGRK